MVAPAPKTTLKRKLKGSTPSRKKSKVTLDGLPWKTVSRPKETGLDGDDGILDLEEVDNVEVVYEETESGRVAKFNVSSLHCTSVYVDRTEDILGDSVYFKGTATF